ncbi:MULTISPECIES: serine hydrolase [unclassified Nocardia]|uniref:serine hydrolase n=1 Tax=unclassified Nocardia TaxID=2637762 RepID=UPI001CE3D7DF|nr:MULTISPECIES: serine hydrolase [unclassified Nocardia]
MTKLRCAKAHLDWIVAVSRNAVPDTEIREHLAPRLLDSGGAKGFAATLAALGPLAVDEIRIDEPERIQAVIRGSAELLLTLHVNPAGLVDDMDLAVPPPPPASWDECDARLSVLGPRISFAAMEIGPGGECRPVHGLAPQTRRPTGSAFKLYVLGALGRAVAEGSARWDEPLAIRDDRKSLPSGTMQNLPQGHTAPLSEYAELMISLSDNTATDHLIHRLGRDAVQRQLGLFGHGAPEVNIPFLTTRAFFRLKAAEPVLAQRYSDLSIRERTEMLESIERQPLPDLPDIWPAPRDIDRIEWFASPIEICRALAGLLRLGQPEIGHALSRTDAGLALDRSRFPTVWYKGGSEPGVVTLHYLARTAAGRTMAASLLVSDPRQPLPTAATVVAAQSALRGAFALMAAPAPARP